MDYNTMPKRVSSLATEIESKKVLQDEQVRAALDANKRLLYYVSGGKENADMNINDKVRPEDQDLRGWFTEKYGNYLAHLTGDLEATKSNKDRVAQIIAHFNETPYGFVLRTGAVNEYHIGRIVTCARQVNEHRTEARKYSKDLAVLCTKLLFSGEAPNNNIFDILHSSIRNFYTMHGVEANIPFEKYIASGSIFNKTTTTYNHTTYCAELILALFDMDTFSRTAGHWEKSAVRGESFLSAQNIRDILGGVDGYGKKSIIQAQARISGLHAERTSAQNTQRMAEENRWNIKPTLTQEIKDIIARQVAFVGIHSDKITATAGPAYKPYLEVKQNLSTYEAVSSIPVGEPLPKGLKLITSLPKEQRTLIPLRIYRESNTDHYHFNYNVWEQALDKVYATEGELATLTDQIATDQAEGSTAADFHKIRAMSIMSQVKKVDDGGTEVDYSADWMRYVYERVRLTYGLPYVAYVTTDGGSWPGLAMPAMPGQVITQEGANSYSVSKAILFYARALQGVTPNAYWSNALSHRLVFKEGNGFTDVFLYAANIKTGGVGTTYTDIAKVTGDKDAASSLIGTYLPDVPLYKPGTNISITPQMEDSYATKISNDPKLQAWVRTSMKSGFNYAYVINSAWLPEYQISNGNTTLVTNRAPTYLLGTFGKHNEHMDWLRATTWSKSNYKGVSTFKPTMETLKFDNYGNKRNVPEFYEGRNALTATEMHCVAFPKRAAENIAKFMEGVPALLSEYLNSTTNQANGPWYDAQRTLTREAFFGDIDRLKRTHSSYLKRYAGKSFDEWDFHEGAFYNTYDYVRTFLLNRTESLFIQDPTLAATKAYNERLKKSFSKGVGQPNLYNTTFFYDYNDFGNAYKGYMTLLGAVAYFNSHEMLTDKPSDRTFAPWAKPFAGQVNSLVNSVLGGATPQTIFTTQINDTADVSNMHKTLQKLGAFDEMLEMPVFDLKEFHAVWQPLTSTGSPIIDSPFLKGGFLNVPQGGLKTTIFPGLKGTYGDVFYQTMMDTCVLNPVITATTDGYVYSSVRVPVNTRGLSSKVYGLRPNTSYSFSQGSNKSDLTSMFMSGSGRLTYTAIGGVTGLLFAGALGVAMLRNIANENAWKDRRFEINYD